MKPSKPRVKAALTASWSLASGRGRDCARPSAAAIGALACIGAGGRILPPQGLPDLVDETGRFRSDFIYSRAPTDRSQRKSRRSSKHIVPSGLRSITSTAAR
jgi:hypothetical protein